MSIISKLHQCPNTLRAEFEKKQADLMASYGLTESEIANPYNPVRAMHFAEMDALEAEFTMNMLQYADTNALRII